MKPRIIKAFKQGDSICVVIPAVFVNELDICPGELLQMSCGRKRMIIERTGYFEGKTLRKVK